MNTLPENKNSSNDPLVKKRSDNKTRRCPIECFIAEKDGKKELCGKIIEDDKEDLYQTLTGTPNAALASSIINRAMATLPPAMNDATKHNIILQTLADSTPRDAHEARLSAQAAVLYVQGMDFLDKARETLYDDTFARQDWHQIFMKAAFKLLDLHNKTVETLARYRQRGKQEIIVQHVNVESGGRAIVGAINGGGGQQQKNDEVPYGHSSNL